MRDEYLIIRINRKMFSRPKFIYEFKIVSRNANKNLAIWTSVKTGW
jgi:hypothetical protein